MHGFSWLLWGPRAGGAGGFWRLSLHLHRLRRPGRFWDRLRPGGSFPRHRPSGFGIGIDRLRLDSRRGRFRHGLRPVGSRLLHPLRRRRPLAVAFGSRTVLAGLWDRLGPSRQRLLHGQGRLGLVGVGGFRGRRCGRLGSFLGLVRRRRLGDFGLDCRLVRRGADSVLRGRGRHRRHGRSHFGFGQIGQQRFHVAGKVRRVSRVRRERFFLVHGAQSKSVYLRGAELETW
jgi:hypothetical protein